MKILTGLFRMARKRTQTKDGAEDFRASLTALVDERESLTDEGVSKKVDELKAMITDLPDSEDKEKLSRYLDDFRAVKEQDEATAKEAVNMVAGLYESLDSSASADAPNATETTTADENSETETAVKETETKDEETATETTKTEETKDEGGEEKRYSLDEIFEMIKTLKDGCKDEGEKVEETKVEEKKDEETKDEGGEVTEDHAPMIPMNISNSASKGSLSELFANMKKGGR
jgi:hypothetical protein